MKKLKFGAITVTMTAVIALIIFFNEISSSKEPALNYESSLRSIPNEAFGFGEKLEYKIGYKFITAGTGYFWILPKPVVRNDDRQCYDIRFRVQSLESLRWIYRVDDNYKTVLDIAGIFPWEFEQHVREGNYKRDTRAVFDQENNIAYSNDKQYKVKPYVHDIVSAFFYVRTLDIGSMKKGQVFYLQNFFEDTTYNLGVKILGKETIDVEAGKFRCIVIQPLVVEGGLFKSEGNIYIWLTDDDRKIPVKVATKILIGYVGAELVRYSGTRGPINAKIE
jgi:hypothetical protein